MGYFKNLAIAAMDEDEEILMNEKRTGWKPKPTKQED